MIPGTGQADVLPSNSFASHYANAGIVLRYHYEEDKAIHNYSGNWDFDADGIADAMYFIGTGGAHLYYYLRVVLSSDRIVRDFGYLESDLPVYAPPLSTGTGRDSHIADSFTSFSVVQQQGQCLIYLRLDTAVQFAARKLLKHHGVKTEKVLLGFNKAKAVLKDYHKN